MKIYNSLSRKVEEFAPISPPNVSMYACGMTVYDYAHIGHGRKYTNDDILRRTLEYLGLSVNHVQNVTDVGHLVSDADSGEDKMEKGAAKAQKTVWEVAQFFTDHFYDSMDSLNILRPTTICKATDHIPDQIALIEKLFANALAYDTPEAVYFNIAKFPSYGKLFGQNIEDKKVAVREEVAKDENKINPADFALWFKRVGRFADHAMHWESPWGDGFPGWHIECSAMSMKYLGEQLDIHTGGEDHLSIHHPNEIAQSEGATGKSPFVKYWVHHSFLMVDGTKMSKSLGNYYTIEDVINKGFDPMALRYFYLTAHYKKQLNFTWEALDAAANAYKKLRAQVARYRQAEERTVLSQEKMDKVADFINQFKAAIEDDLNMPQALSVVWEAVKSNIPDYDKYDLVKEFDKVLGLKLDAALEETPITQEAKELLDQRQALRKEGKFGEADAIRKKLEEMGIAVSDDPVK